MLCLSSERVMEFVGGKEGIMLASVLVDNMALHGALSRSKVATIVASEGRGSSGARQVGSGLVSQSTRE